LAPFFVCPYSGAPPQQMRNVPKEICKLKNRRFDTANAAEPEGMGGGGLYTHPHLQPSLVHLSFYCNSGGISIYIYISDRLCGLVVRVLDYRSRGPGFDPRPLPKEKVVGLERGPLSLVSTTEELLDRKVAAPV
jgi:hypothetical protein